jgi:hypothetical protein
VRIRQVKPAFWTDSRLALLPAATRLFYIGLWNIADDTGWLRWEVPTIGAELYGYEPRMARERRVAAMGDALEQAGRITRYPCGHALIPTLTEHQRMSAATKRVKTVEKEHERCSADARGSQRTSAAPRPVGNVSPSGTDGVNGTVTDLGAPARAGEPAGPRAAATEFEEKVPRLVALGDA